MCIEFNSWDFYRAGFSKFEVLRSLESLSLYRNASQSQSGAVGSAQWSHRDHFENGVFEFAVRSSPLSQLEMSDAIDAVRANLSNRGIYARGQYAFELFGLRDSPNRYWIRVADEYEAPPRHFSGSSGTS